MKHASKTGIAYTGFLMGGVICLIITFIGYLKLDTGQAGVLGFLILLPLSIIGVIAILTSIGFALVFHLDWQLNMLAVLSVVFLAGLIFDIGDSLLYNFSNIIYGVVATYLPVRWFYKTKLF